MSRVGKNPIPVPATVTVVFKDGILSISSAELLSPIVRQVPEDLVCLLSDGSLTVSPVVDPAKIDSSRKASAVRAKWGLFRKLIANDISGVSSPFLITLEIAGIGYKAVVTSNGRAITLNLGFSHDVVLQIPEGIEATCIRNVVIELRGRNKRALGDFAAKLQSLRAHDPYKLKGIRRKGSFLRKKEGKAG